MCENIVKYVSFGCKEAGSCDNVALEVQTMSTAIAYDNSFQVLKVKKKGLVETIKDVIATHNRYEGLFTASQAAIALDITRQRFSQIEDRLEKVPVPMMGNREYYTGRGLIAYRQEAIENIK